MIKSIVDENLVSFKSIERYTDGLIFTAQMKEIVEILSAATTASRKVFRDAFIR